MPLYEYECQRCHRRIEKIQSFAAEPLRLCESCGGPLEKLLSASAFQFKGSGWYVTDYARSKPTGGDAKPAAEGAAAAKGSEAPPAKPDGAASKDVAPAKPAPSSTEK
ncbi:MAG: FmdB family zinc ribbon protein [Terriglobales bacterium]